MTSKSIFSLPPTARLRAELPELHLRLRLSERKLLLLIMDLALVQGALLLALQAYTQVPLAPADLVSLAKWFLTLAGVWMACALFFNCYDLPLAAHAARSVGSAVSAALLTVVIYTLTPWLTPPLISRGLIFVFTALAVASVALWRLVYASLFVQSWFKQRALVVGAGHAGRELATSLQFCSGTPNPYRGTGYDLVGYVDDNPALQHATVEGLPVLGGHEMLPALVRTLKVHEIIVAITHRHAIDDELFRMLVACTEQGLRVTTMAALYERALGRVAVDHVGRDLDSVLPMEEAIVYRLYTLVKRAIDLFAAAAVLIVLGAAIPGVALANALVSPGPLFYRQQRVGKGGRCFEILKFRSMVPDAEHNTGAVWASNGDARITPVGKWLRRSRLDELPQVLNILRGEMSLIGPRPERPEFVTGLAQSQPFYRARHAVRPGLTGWAQVQYRYGNTVDDARIKLEYDLYYVKHMNLLLDLQILFRTVAVVLQMKGM